MQSMKLIGENFYLDQYINTAGIDPMLQDGLLL